MNTGTLPRSHGRDREIDLVQRVLDDVLEGRPRTLVIEGEPGIGKTRLLTEATALAGGRGRGAARQRAPVDRRKRLRTRLDRRRTRSSAGGDRTGRRGEDTHRKRARPRPGPTDRSQAADRDDPCDDAPSPRRRGRRPGHPVTGTVATSLAPARTRRGEFRPGDVRQREHRRCDGRPGAGSGPASKARRG
ncbi:MAG: AAA family ATPase [Propionibacteriales bacterium]|nr:AAA family ATPase [Propionibacteriales bacterium]